jgi:hypothetical protein
MSPGSGYLHESYARSLSEVGSPLALPRSGGWLLKRRVPLSGAEDAMGCYPLFACRDWSQLGADIEALPDSLVSITVVTDPFGDYDEALLRSSFVDLVIPFKEHFITDLTLAPDAFITRHHRYYLRKASAQVHVEPLVDHTGFIDSWVELYECLVKRHGLRGVRVFSRAAFEQQLCVPGLVVLRATHRGAVVGAQLWYIQGDVAYSHLTAFSPMGYQLRTSYAIYGAAMEYFRGRVRWLERGAGAGLDNSADGLTVFKRGWSTGLRTAYLCGRILRPREYEELRARTGKETTYFPAYREGEYS